MANLQKATRFYELDLLRFFAAMGVVLFHYTFLDVVENKSAPRFPMLEDIAKYGYFGVEFFFMISGFVILLTAQNKNWQGFILSRVSRLYPAFWIAVSITSIAILLLGSAQTDLTFPQYLWNLTMIPEYVNVQNIDSVYWTLQIEIKFYFWIFIILLFNKIHHLEWIIFGWLILAVLDIFHVAHEVTHYIFMPERVSYFSAGALFYLIKTKGWSQQRIALIILAYILSVYFALKDGSSKSEIEAYNTVFSPYVLLSLLSIYYLIFAFIISENKPQISKAWLVTLFVNLGGISYPLYLLHNKFGELLFIKLSFINNKYLLLFTIISIVMTLSFILYRYIERKFAFNMKQKLKYYLLPAAN